MNIIKCEEKICTKFVTKMQKQLQDLINDFQKSLPKYTKNEQKIINKKIKEITIQMKSKKFIKDSTNSCKKFYCNPSCKGTMFQDEKSIENNKNLTNNEKKLSKALFKNKKPILDKNGFYIDLPSKNKDKLQKKGAISLCAMASFLI